MYKNDLAFRTDKEAHTDNVVHKEVPLPFKVVEPSHKVITDRKKESIPEVPLPFTFRPVTDKEPHTDNVVHKEVPLPFKVVDPSPRVVTDRKEKSIPEVPLPFTFNPNTDKKAHTDNVVHKEVPLPFTVVEPPPRVVTDRKEESTMTNNNLPFGYNGDLDNKVAVDNVVHDEDNMNYSSEIVTSLHENEELVSPKVASQTNYPPQPNQPVLQANYNQQLYPVNNQQNCYPQPYQGFPQTNFYPQYDYNYANYLNNYIPCDLNSIWAAGITHHDAQKLNNYQLEKALELDYLSRKNTLMEIHKMRTMQIDNDIKAMGLSPNATIDGTVSIQPNLTLSDITNAIHEIIYDNMVVKEKSKINRDVIYYWRNKNYKRHEIIDVEKDLYERIGDCLWDIYNERLEQVKIAHIRNKITSAIRNISYLNDTPLHRITKHKLVHKLAHKDTAKNG